MWYNQDRIVLDIGGASQRTVSGTRNLKAGYTCTVGIVIGAAIKKESYVWRPT